jgi:hypothetical protein
VTEGSDPDLPDPVTRFPGGANGVVGSSGEREARLRPEFARRYPYLTPGVWEPAAVLADRVVAAILGRPDGRFISRERALDPDHFEFRGEGPRPPATAVRREDA